MTNRLPIAQFSGSSRLRLALALLLCAASPRALAQADDDPDGPATVSRPVVQSTAPSPSRELNAALARLGADPRNVAALLDAASAALKLGDSDAAIGFLARADEVQPGNVRTKALLGKAQLVAENPVEAIRAFDEAERTGADTFAMAADRALAYDLVGDNGRAQRWYQVALSRGGDDEITRRYAMSLAISGDRRGAEALLAPLIEKQDRAAWRTRTFAMAVTGGPDEAVAIAYASMPQDLASGIAPYLRYMPRLTPAQQAAAANFGRFPRAADIGRDDPRVVQYAALNPRAPRTAEAGLIPAGAPLGPSVAASEKPSREKRRRPGKSDSATSATVVVRPAVRTSPPAELPPVQTYASAAPAVRPDPPSSTTPVVPRPTVLSALDVPPGSVRPAVPPIRPAPSASAQSPVARPLTTPAPTTTIAPSANPIARPGFQQDPTAAPANNPARATASPPAQASSVAIASAAPVRAGPTATTQPASPVGAANSRPAPSLTPAGGFDLAKVGPASVPPPATAASPTTASATAPGAAPAPVGAQVAMPAAVAPVSSSPEVQTAAANTPPPARDLATLFKSFAPPPEERATSVPAVDITRIAPASAAKAVKPDPRGERPDGPTDVSRVPTKEPQKPSAKDAVKLGKDGKPVKDPKAAAKEAQEAKAKKAGPSHPSRIWVQVLTGANKDVMDTEWRRLLKEAPALLRSRKPYLSPWRSNFRLLTGPFASESEAQDFVTKLKKDGVSSYQWTSPAGQPVDTLSLK